MSMLFTIYFKKQGTKLNPSLAFLFNCFPVYVKIFLIPLHNKGFYVFLPELIRREVIPLFRIQYVLMGIDHAVLVWASVSLLDAVSTM